MAEKTSWSGAALAETDINTYLRHTGGAWNTWTPAITQSGSVAVTVNTATYWRAGRFITAQVFLTVTGSGTASNVITCSLPVTSASLVSGLVFGSGNVYDSSTTTDYPCNVRYLTTTSVTFQGNSGTLGNPSFTAGLASGDQITFTITYEAAS